MESGDHTPTTEELLQQILNEQRAHRQEIATLKANQSTPAPPAAAAAYSAEELAQQRAEQIANHDFYCPGCGKLVNYQQQCHGTAEQPHPPIEVVSTDELRGDDPSQHTPAPATTNLG